MHGCFALSMSMHHVHALGYLHRSEENVGLPRTGVADGCELSCVSWGSILGFSRKASVFLTTKQCLWYLTLACFYSKFTSYLVPTLFEMFNSAELGLSFFWLLTPRLNLSEACCPCCLVLTLYSFDSF